MRKLGLTDVFAFSAILDKMDLKLNAQELMAEAKGAPDLQQFVGGQIMLMLAKDLHKAEKEIVAWVGSINDLTEDEVMALSFKELYNLIKDIFSGEDVTDFFNLLSMEEQD